MREYIPYICINDKKKFGIHLDRAGKNIVTCDPNVKDLTNLLFKIKKTRFMVSSTVDFSYEEYGVKNASGIFSEAVETVYAMLIEEQELEKMSDTHWDS